MRFSPAVVLAVCVAALLPVWEPKTVVPLSVLILGASALATRGPARWLDLATLAYGGTVVLGYGFVNIGLASSLPVPLVDVLMIVLAARAATEIALPRRLRQSVGLGLAYLSVAAVRLTIDVPTWGNDAIRDFTTPIEVVGYFLVGYWLVSRYGSQAVLKRISWVFVVAVAYFLLYPARTSLQGIGPTVGLQRSVPLLGQYAGAGPAAASAFFFFALVRPFGTRWSILLAGATLAPLAMVQSRGIYLSVPLAAICVLVTSRQRSTRTGRRIAAAFAMGVAALAVVLVVAPQGRLSTVSLASAESQITSLGGHHGTEVGTIQLRKQWASSTLRRVEKHHLGWLFGLGLGPDLASGFRAENGALVRKPHDDYLEAFARLGVLGFVPFVAFFGLVVATIASRARRLTAGDARVLWWVVATAVVYLFIAATQPLLAFAYGTVPLLVPLGAGLALALERDGVLIGEGETAL